MQISLPKYATFKQKFVRFFMYLTLILVCPAIFFKNILIDQLLISYLAKISMIISLPIILLIVESINNENPTITLSRNWKQIVGFSLYVPFVLYTSISVGLPSVLHLAISKPAEIEVTVEHKGTGRRGRGPYIYVEEYTYFLNNQVYGIQKEQWETLKPGNKIQLFGKKSYFGFSYSKYKIIR